MTQSPTVDKILEVSGKCQLWLQQTYNHQSEELKIWFVIGIIVIIVLAIFVVSLFLQKTLNRLNSWMQTEQGWKPIRYSTIMWAGSGIWAILGSFYLRHEGSPGWTVALALGILAIISLIWLLVARIGLLKTLAASTVNFGAGAIIAPIVIQFGVFAIVIAVALSALCIWAALQPTTVYVRR